MKTNNDATWINIDEKLPGHGDVLVFTKSGRICLAQHQYKYLTDAGYFALGINQRSGGWLVWDTSQRVSYPADLEDVTHWQPVPLLPPPKPDKTAATTVIQGKYQHQTNCPQRDWDLHICCCGCGRVNHFVYCPNCTQKLDWN